MVCSYFGRSMRSIVDSYELLAGAFGGIDSEQVEILTWIPIQVK